MRTGSQLARSALGGAVALALGLSANAALSSSAVAQNDFGRETALFLFGIEAGTSSTPTSGWGWAGNNWISGSAHSNPGFIGVDGRVYGSGFFYIPGSDTVLSVRRSGVRPFAGAKARIFNNGETQVLASDQHPTPGLDTFLFSREFWAFKGYLGLSIIFNEFMISPYLGWNLQQRQIRFVTDESGGGGQFNSAVIDALRCGPALGIDFDYLPQALPFFVGVGVQVDWLRGLGGAFTSSNNINYAFATQESAILSLYVRLGMRFGGGNQMIYASDARLKRDIHKIGERSDGLGIYRYRYLWSDTEYVGLMAQEVERVRPDAVVQGADGFLRVDYGRLGARMMTWDSWRARRTAEASAR